MSPKLPGRAIPRSTGLHRTNLRVLAALATEDAEQIADAALGTLGDSLTPEQICTVCGFRLDPWHVQRGHTTHLEDPL